MTPTLVVDCSVATKWVLREPGHEEALQFLRKEKAGEIWLIAPDLLLTEFASLIAKRVRRKQILAVEAEEAFDLLQESAPLLFETPLLLDAALKLALQHHASLWDCVYVALAVQHDCPLVTADQRLFSAGRRFFPELRLLGRS